MGEATLLELDGSKVVDGPVFPGLPLVALGPGKSCLEVFDEGVELDLENLVTDVGPVAGFLTRLEGIVDLLPVGVARHRYEDGGGPEL